MNRKLIKKQARQALNNNEIGFIGLYLLKVLAVPILLVIFWSIMSVSFLGGNATSVLTMAVMLPFMTILVGLLTVAFDLSADFICLLVSKNILQSNTVGISSNIDIFAKRRCFWGAFGTRFFSNLYVELWQIPCNLVYWVVSLLLTPLMAASPIGALMFMSLIYFLLGIAEAVFLMYKGYSYSQAEYVYWDYILDGKYITCFEAIRLSERLMKGHKVDYFLFQWSFFWWFLLSVITLGLGSFYVYPYYCLSTANYYTSLASYTGNTPDSTMIGGYAPTNQFSKHDNKHNPLTQERKYLHDTPNASNNYMHD